MTNNPSSLDFKEIPHDGDQFELFCRDFLSEYGLYIETPPNRGADGGKDMLVIERRTGSIANTEFRWLVSCKHFAASDRSVGPADEINIVERVSGFEADGFLGFYSTIPSAGLISELDRLANKKLISEYRIFDHRIIESILIANSRNLLMARYLPTSFGATRPLSTLWGKVIDLRCHVCGRDLLDIDFIDSQMAMIVYASKLDDDKSEKIFEVKTVCKGECDQIYEGRLGAREAYTSWMDIHRVCMPSFFADYVRNVMLAIQEGRYEIQAVEQLGEIVRALAQRVMRIPTAKEKAEYKDLVENESDPWS
ncbi:MAG: restriction endonuclease [Chlorobia bacterium]|nr:restriction endonuclease [Fimbriimonadaceae bacterium]